MASEELSKREWRVLEAVIRTYIETAEPAGSRTLSQRSGLGVSPATIRNTMSDLEEKGFLFHPHTSAGRIPTHKAYRSYVDGLMVHAAVPPVAETDRLALELTGELCPLQRILAEKRFQLRVLHGFRRLAKSLLAVFQRFDQAIDGGYNFFLLTHSKINTHAAPTERVFFPRKVCSAVEQP